MIEFTGCTEERMLVTDRKKHESGEVLRTVGKGEHAGIFVDWGESGELPTYLSSIKLNETFGGVKRYLVQGAQ